jgi:hypothetical protein
MALVVISIVGEPALTEKVLLIIRDALADYTLRNLGKSTISASVPAQPSQPQLFIEGTFQ